MRWRLDMRLKDRQMLVQFMDYKDFSVRELADAAGVSRSLIGHLRSGHRNTCKVSNAKKIETALGAPLGLLFEPVASNVLREAGERAAVA